MQKRIYQADFPVIDMDGHIFEDPIIFSEYLEPKFRERAKRALVEQPLGLRGLGGMAMFGTPASTGNKYRMFADSAEAAVINRKFGEGYCYPGQNNGAVRLSCMDAEGIDAMIVRNTMMAGIFHLCEPDLVEALCIAYNNWVRDFCDADPNRLYPEALLPCADMAATMKEMERCAKLGFKSAVVRGSTAGIPLSDAHYDPMFACMQEMGWPLFIHAAFDPCVPSGAQLLLSPANMQSSSAGAYLATFLNLNFILDNIVTMGEITLGGMLDKFPGLNVIFIESGSTWASEVVYRLDKNFNDPFAGVPPDESWARDFFGRPLSIKAKTPPSELFERQIYLPFEGGDRAHTKEGVERMAKNLVWASDIPHFDGDGPWEGGGCLRDILHVDRKVEAMIMGGNAARLLNIPCEKRVDTSKNAAPIPDEVMAVYEQV